MDPYPHPTFYVDPDPNFTYIRRKLIFFKTSTNFSKILKILVLFNFLITNSLIDKKG